MSERTGLVTLDDVTTVSALYDPTQRWNGFLACPWLTREQVEQVLTALAANAPADAQLTWTWLDDEEGRGAILRTVDHNYVDPARPEYLENATEDLLPREDGRYSLGAFAWVWSEVEEVEVVEHQTCTNVTVHDPACRCGITGRKTYPPEERVIAWGREETDPCESGTPGCSIDHRADTHDSCETW